MSSYGERHKLRSCKRKQTRVRSRDTAGQIDVFSEDGTRRSDGNGRDCLAEFSGHLARFAHLLPPFVHQAVRLLDSLAEFLYRPESANTGRNCDPDGSRCPLFAVTLQNMVQRAQAAAGFVFMELEHQPREIRLRPSETAYRQRESENERREQRHGSLCRPRYAQAYR